MELRVYSPELNFLGLSENQTSIIWTRKFNEIGTFQITLPITPDNVNLYKIGNIVTFRKTVDAGVIEDLILRENYSERVLIAGGRMLASYMDRRLIRPTYNFSGKVEIAMRNILSNAAALPLVELGTLNNFAETVDFQATYKNLLDYEIKLAQSAAFGFRFKPDFTEKKIYFDIYKGVDRTRGNGKRAFVEFSEKFDNIEKAENRRNNQIYKNLAYVAGEGDGSARTVVIVGDDTMTGLPRRELYVDARDLVSDGLTTAQYKAKLYERGVQKLKNYPFSDSLTTYIMPTGNFEYLKDYDVGDVVTVRKYNWGVDADMRITAITETYEHEQAIIEPTFGDTLPTAIDWEDL